MGAINPTQINWKSVKVNKTENVITTAMMGVSSGRVTKRNCCHGDAPSRLAAS